MFDESKNPKKSQVQNLMASSQPTFRSLTLSWGRLFEARGGQRGFQWKKRRTKVKNWWKLDFNWLLEMFGKNILRNPVNSNNRTKMPFPLWRNFGQVIQWPKAKHWLTVEDVSESSLAKEGQKYDEKLSSPLDRKKSIKIYADVPFPCFANIIYMFLYVFVISFIFI